MLRHLRDYFPKWLMATFLGLIALLIVGASLYSPYQSAVANQVVAKVHGGKIKRIEWESTYEKIKELSRLEQGRLTEEEEKILRAQVLEQLIIKQVLQQHLHKKGYRIHPKTILNYIQNDPVLRQNFSKKQRLLKGYSQSDFLKQIRQYRLSAQGMEAVVQSAFVLPEEVRQAVALIKQSRDFRYLELKPEQFAISTTTLPLQEVQAYYSQQLSNFRIPEKISIDYVLLNRADISELEADQVNNKDDKVSHWQEKIQSLTALTKTQLSLAEAASQLSLTIHTTDLFDKSGGSEPITKHPKVIEIAFSQAVREGQNSALIQLDPERIIVLRINRYEPLRLATFEEVEEQVRNQLSLVKAKEAAKKRSEDYVMELKQDANARLELPKATQWRKVEKAGLDSTSIPLTVLHTAFSASLKEKVSSVCLPNGNCILIQLSKIRYGRLSQLTDEEQAVVNERLGSEKGQLDYQCYVAASKRDATITYSAG